jgi:hypothetical protein
MFEEWYVLVRDNDPSTYDHQKMGLTSAEVELNRNVPILIHWDKNQLPTSPGFHIVKVRNPHVK